MEGRDWFDELRRMRRRWVDANRENGFDRGIWNATVEKYADPAHFLFELMQNAEDEGANRAELAIREEAIVFEHDGGQFVPDDVRGITGIGNTTKFEEANKIGCFGIGFKSVYVVTERPEVHTWIDDRPFAFAIGDLVVPEEIPFEGRKGWTRFVLPLRKDSSAVALRVVEALRECGPRSMLFLDRLRRLDWNDGAVGERYSVEHGDGGARVLRREDEHGIAGVERYLVLSRSVPEEGSVDEHSVKVALKLNGDGDVVRSDTGTKLAVFFETEEQTGLFFHVHGPFRLTDNRANVKRGDPWNDSLVKQIGDLLVDSLPGLRDAGLLKRSFLEVLPNEGDDLPAPWSKLLDPLVAAFRTQELTPALFGGHLPASRLVRGPSDLRELMGDEGLRRVTGKSDLRWSVTGLRNRRDEVFLGSLGIPEWGAEELVNALCADVWTGGRKHVWDWFDGLADDDVQRLYLFLDAAKLPINSALVRSVRFVRLENGKRVRVCDALLPQPGDGADGEVDADELPLVRQTLIRGGRGRGKEVEGFLRRIGVQVVSERHYLGAIAKRFYRETSISGPTYERHMKHVRRFVAWWKEHGNVEPFAGASWLRGDGVEGYRKAEGIYLDDPFVETGLALIYGGRIPGLSAVPLWSGYSRLRREDLVGLVQTAGGRAGLVVRERSVPYDHPHNNALTRGLYGVRRTSTRTDKDHVIDGLHAMLALRDPRISALVWRTIAAQRIDVLRAKYSPNQQYPVRTELSTLAHVLATTEWIPAADGTMKSPRALTADGLAPGFDYAGNAPWLNALEFGADHRRRSERDQGRRNAAESMGLPPGFADAFDNVPQSEREAVIARLMECMTDRPVSGPDFPERSSANPERRAMRVAERARAAPARSYEVRPRSVRTSGGDVLWQARELLRDYYTNDAGEMVCQACHREMPFRLADGSPYFEAVEYLPDEGRELVENHLALCPTCAAKWRHANGETREARIAALEVAEEPHTFPDLAGTRIRLRFVDVHLQDLKTALGIGSVKADEEASEAEV